MKLKNKKPIIKKIKRNKKEKNTIKKRKIWTNILIVITIFAIICLVLLAGFGYYIVKSAPEFDPEKLYEKEATLVYDANNNLIATLGIEKREKVVYEELPEVLVDAIIATEDSRFFQHNGFDLPRFLKASVGQLLGNSSAGGASTLTMQVSKNTFTSVEASGIQGIIRKFTDIYLSIFKIEKYYTKKEILEFYVNSPFLGSSSYGVEQACQTYFGKSVSDISLSEAALIAGLFQAPGAYDPYSNPENAEARRNIVLNLMVRHGYINVEEKEAAKAIKVKDMLTSNRYVAINQYQGFIDTVIVEVKEKTGNDPYQIPMEIYTTMNPSKQNVINNFYSNYQFLDEKVQVGIALIDNDTGAILAVGAGRNKKTELSFNYATMTNRHPGSTAKPIFDYGPGIEYNKWSTYTPFFDSKTYYSSGGSISNWNGSYSNKVRSLKYCLSQSLNTCALQAFKQVDNEKIYDFVTSLGIKPESDNGYIGEAHSVGGFTGVSPVTLAAAYSAFASGGYYTEPYSVKKVIYRDTNENQTENENEVYEANVKRKRVMSAQTAYMITNVLYGVTPSGAGVSGTNVATKTGTATYDSKLLKEVGVSNVIRDSWVASYTPDYTMAFWYGYDKLNKEYKDNKWYCSMTTAGKQRQNIQKYLNSKIYEKNSKFKSPGGIVNTKVELETIPAQKPSDFTPKDLIETHLFIAGTEPTETSTRFSKLAKPSNLSILEEGNNLTLNWVSPGTPSAVDSEYLLKYYESGYGDFADKYYQNRLSYNTTNIGTFGYNVYLIQGTTIKNVGFTNDTSYTINLNNYSGTYDAVMVKSSYSIFKSNQSEGTITYLSSYEAPTSISITLSNKNLTKNNNWNGATKEDISSISINGNTITDFTLIGSVNNLLPITTITKNESISSLTELNKSEGTYIVNYSVTFSCTVNGVIKQYTQGTNQTVIVE